MVSVRDAKKAQNKIKQQADAYKEACKLVDEIYNNPNSIIDWRTLGKALRVIEGMDSQFAADVRKDLELREAYQIVGGYNQRVNSVVEEKRFNKAMQLVEKDDPQFAQALKELHIQGTSFKNASNNQLATAEQIVKNAQTLCTDYSDDSLYNDVVEDKEVAEAYANTPVNENLSDEEYKRTTFAAAQNEVISELAENVEYSQANSKKKRNLLVSHLKTSVKRILFGARRASGGNDIASIKKALNFKEKVSVSASSIASAYENAQTKTTAYIKKLYEKGHTKAAAFLNKAKTKVQSSMVKLAAASILLTSLMPSCSNNNSSRTPMPAAQQKVVVLDNTAKSSADIVSDKVSTDSISAVRAAQQTTVVRDTIAVPSEWSDSLGVSKGNWTANQTFMDYGKAYQKVTDDMLAKSGFQTRDQFLDAYRILRSYYPNVIENQGDVLLARTETSERFSKFFNNDDCIEASELTDEDYEILKMAPTLRGNLNVRSTQETKDDEPCEPGKVQYESVVTQKNEPQESATQKPETPSDEQGQSPVVQDTVPQFTIKEEGRSRVVLNTDTDTIPSVIDLLKGNSLDDGKVIGTVSADDVVGKKTTEKKGVLVEQTNQNNSKGSSNAHKFTGFNEQGSSRTVDVPAETDSAKVIKTTVSQLKIVELGSSRTVDVSAGADSAKVDTTKVQQFTGFDEQGASKTVDISDSAAATAETDSVQIVSDSADLPVGTPAAGHVKERGGVDNCGLTAEQLQYSKSKIADRHGSSAYEDLMDGISDEMLSKGNIFEGLTKEQAIYNLSVWSVVYPHSEETSLIYDYVLNCHKGEKMSADNAAKAKAAMDRIRTNKTIDDVVYSEPIYVVNVKNMGCDERVQVNAEQLSEDVAPTSPSGPKFPRLYKRITPRSDEPIQWKIKEFGRSRTVVTTITKETKSPSIQKYKGNNMDISESKYLGEIEAKDIVGKEVTERKNVLVEETSTEVTAQAVDKKAIKEAKKKQLQEQKAAAKANKKAKKKKADKKVDKKEAPEVGTLEYWKAKMAQEKQQQ